MLKPKKLEIGVSKNVQAKGHSKHQKEMHVLEKPQAKSQRQMNVNDTSQPKLPKHSKSSPR